MKEQIRALMAVKGRNETLKCPSEQTPLLRDDGPDSISSPDRQEPVVEEPSIRELIVILGSIWVGVFLAALGKCTKYTLHRVHSTLRSF